MEQRRQAECSINLLPTKVRFILEVWRYFVWLVQTQEFNFINIVSHSSGHSHSIFTSAHDNAHVQEPSIRLILEHCLKGVNICGGSFSTTVFTSHHEIDGIWGGGGGGVLASKLWSPPRIVQDISDYVKILELFDCQKVNYNRINFSSNLTHERKFGGEVTGTSLKGGMLRRLLDRT